MGNWGRLCGPCRVRQDRTSREEWEGRKSSVHTQKTPTRSSEGDGLEFASEGPFPSLP